MLLSEGNSAPHVDDLMHRSDTGQVNYLFGGVVSEWPRTKDDQGLEPVPVPAPDLEPVPAKGLAFVLVR